MRRSSLLLLVALAGCVPSRAAVFDPVARGGRARLGRPLTWRAGPATAATRADVDRALAAPLDAAAAVTIALAASDALQARFARLGIATGAIAVDGAWPDPTIGAAWRRDGAGHDALELHAALDVSAAWIAGARRAAAEAGLDAARAEALAAAVEVARRARDATFAAAAAERVAALRIDAAEAAAAAAQLGEELHASGNLTDLALAELQVAREEAALARDAAGEAAAAARDELFAALGVAAPADGLALAPLPAPPQAAPDLAELGAQARAASLRLAADRAAADAADRGLAAGRRAAIPRLSLGAAAEREDGAWSWGPSIGLSLPLFDGGGGARAVARAAAEEADHAARADAREVELAAIRAARRVGLAHRRVRHQVDVVLPLRRRIVEEGLRQHNAMNRTPFQLLLDRRAELAAEEVATEAARDYWRALSDVDALRAGGLPGDDGDAAPTAALPIPSASTGGH